MGREIVYCVGCGINLREDDFAKGRAQEIDNRPYCAKCKPVPVPAGAKTASSGKKIPAPPPPAETPRPSRKSGTGPVPLASGASRRPSPAPAPEKSNASLVVGGTIAAFVFLILVVAVTGRSSPPPPVVSPPYVAPPPVERRTSRPPDPPPSRAESREPSPIPPANPPTVRRPDPPPAEPLVVPSATRKLDEFLARIRSMIQDDRGFDRTAEVLSMFAAAAKGAGDRMGEVEKMKSEYLKAARDAGAPVGAEETWGGWRVMSGKEAEAPSVLLTHAGRKNVYVTHPLDKDKSATLERAIVVPTRKKTALYFWIAPHEKGDFELRVSVDGKQTEKKIIGPPNSGWKMMTVDLTPWAGKTATVLLENHSNDWAREFAYWSDFEIRSE